MTALLAPLPIRGRAGLVVIVSAAAGRRHEAHFNVTCSVAKAADPGIGGGCVLEVAELARRYRIDLSRA